MGHFFTQLVGAAAGIGLDYSFLLDAQIWPALLRGAGVTVELTLITGFFSVVAGVLFAAMLTSSRRVASAPTRIFVEITRNTPTLVQLFCAFLVLNMLITQALHGARNPLTATAWVVIVMSLHVGAYHADALRAGIEAVPRVTLESASSLGFSRFDVLTRIQLPLALRFALPSIVNNMVEMAKLTTVASAIAVGDITYESIMIWSQRDNVLELMILILLLFSILTLVIHRLGIWAERRMRMPGYGQ